MMNMAQKHLHELLREDQEPFQLKSYIADRCCQLKRPLQNSQLQLKKCKPISQTSKFPSNFCKNACFFSFHDSPDPRKSPLFEFPSPAAKSPCRSPNKIFLHIPARTAALLLEAALRIQKQKTQNKNNGVGLFGSIRRKLTHRSRTRKRESSCDEVKLSVRDILKWDSKSTEQFKEQMMCVEEKSAVEISAFEMSFSPSFNGRPSSAVWSESNEDKSLDLDLETSCSSQSEDFEKEIEFVCKEKENIDFASYEKHFCESPFRFVLQRSPSSGSRTPEFTSPVTSPSHHKEEDKESHQEIEALKKFQVEDEEEKEQCSPVSVLDPPFEDDEDGHEEDENEQRFDLECSYALVQRTKQQLLHKLRRFEKLAELDPIELEKRMLEQEEGDQDDDADCEAEECEECESDYYSDKEKTTDGFAKEVLNKFSFHNAGRIPEDIKRLVTDLIVEEEKDQNCCVDREVIAKRVCRRLESWKEVEANTIDMMVEQDFRREVDGWKNFQEQVGEAAVEIEVAIFGLLMEEFSEELVSTGN